jgi:hypothetical protein
MFIDFRKSNSTFAEVNTANAPISSKKYTSTITMRWSVDWLIPE